MQYVFNKKSFYVVINFLIVYILIGKNHKYSYFYTLIITYRFRCNILDITPYIIYNYNCRTMQIDTQKFIVKE